MVNESLAFELQVCSPFPEIIIDVITELLPGSNLAPVEGTAKISLASLMHRIFSIFASE